MKKQLIILLIAIAPFAGKAQIDFGSFLEAGASDAEKLLEGYLRPAFLGFGYGINSGWYNTAKPHKLLGFDITPTVSFARVPSKDEFFSIDDTDFNNLTVIGTIDENGNVGNRITDSPTLFGPNLPNESLPFLQYTSDNGTPGDTSDDTQVNISAPTGLGLDEAIGISAVPSGMVQVGIGLIKGTELKLRIIPKVEATNDQGQSEFEFQMFGLGFMHDLKQWVPGFKQLPIDVSGFVGWNRITTTIALDPDLGQRATFSTSSFTLQGLVSKQLAILTLFGGVGVATTRTQFELLGEYETEGGTFVDPLSFDFTSTGPRINLGFRLKLLILTLHADYAIQKYSTLTTGIGISIR
ncbi:MAG: DUF6588 family protein [Cyclobacteriaceae bacterium]